MFPWPSIAAAALAAAWLSVIGLSSGGLAVVVTALAASVFAGIPVARWVQDTPVSPRLRHLGRGVKMVAAVAVLGGVLSASPLPGPLRAMIAGSVWMLASVVGPRPWSRLGAVTLVLATIAGVAGLGHWTLLEPHWTGWQGHVASSAVIGLLLAGAGGSTWLGVPRRAHPALAVGLGGLALIGMALVLALVWEMGGAWSVVLGLALAVSGVLGSTEGLEHRTLALPGALLAGSLALVPVSAAVAAVHVVFPATLAVFFGVAAVRQGRRGALGAVASIGCAALAWWAWPGIPSSISAAIALSLVPVALVWTVGSVSLTAQEAA